MNRDFCRVKRSRSRTILVHTERPGIGYMDLISSDWNQEWILNVDRSRTQIQWR